MRRTTRWSLAALLLIPAAAAAAGGWAVITVHDLPEGIAAGQTAALEFTVRQHGVEPMAGLQPRVTARNGRRSVSAAVSPAGRHGTYAAALTVPEPGDWTITLESGYHNANVELMPITARAAGAQLVRQPLAQRGRSLFIAKGCLTCHRHADVAASTRNGAGPELSERRYDVNWLARFIDDPSGTRPPADPGNRMPDLELTPAEIAALVTFINAGGGRVAGR